MDIFVTAPTAVLPTTPSQSALAYAGNASSISPVPLNLASGNYRIRAIASGDTTRAIAFDSGTVTLSSGASTLLAIVPVTGSAAAFNLLSIGADGTLLTIADQRVQVRIGNFAPGNGSVDAYFDANGAGNGVTAPFATVVAEGLATPYQDLLPGAVHASFTVTGQSTELIGSDVALAAGTTVSVYAAGVANQAAPSNLRLVTVRDDLRAPPVGMAKLRLLNLAPDVAVAGVQGNVDLVTLAVSGTTATILNRPIVNLAYPGASTYVDLAPGSYTFALVPAGLSAPLLPTATTGVVVNLNSATITTLVINGCEFPGTGICASVTTPLQLLTITD